MPVQVPWDAGRMLSLTASQPSPWLLKVWSLDQQPGHIQEPVRNADQGSLRCTALDQPFLGLFSPGAVLRHPHTESTSSKAGPERR